MKTLLLFSMMALSFSALAEIGCPAKTKQIGVCLSTPKSGDGEVASTVFDSITICEKTKTIAILNVEKNGEAENAVATISMRMGGTEMLVESPMIDFSLTLTTGIDRNKDAVPAKFRVVFKDSNIVSTSSYTCDME